MCRQKAAQNVDFAGETSLFVDSDRGRGQLALSDGLDGHVGGCSDNGGELRREDGRERLRALVLLTPGFHFRRHDTDAAIASHEGNDDGAAGGRVSRNRAYLG